MLRRQESALAARLRARRAEESDPLLREVREQLEREKRQTATDKWARRASEPLSEQQDDVTRWFDFDSHT